MESKGCVVGILSNESIKRRCPEMFPVDFATHQQLYASQDVQKHQLDGIKIPKTPQHIKVKPRYPIYDLFTHAQAVAPLNPSVKSAVGVYRRAISDAVKREAADPSIPAPPPTSATLQVALPQKRKRCRLFSLAISKRPCLHRVRDFVKMW